MQRTNTTTDDGSKKMITSDDALMCKFQDGDESAFRRLLERYQDRILNYVLRMVSDYDTASDIAQEVFIKVYINAGRYLPGSRFSPWLYRIATNLAINELRRRKRWRFLSIDEAATNEERNYHFELADTKSLSPEERVMQREDVLKVEEALAKVALKYRTPLILREIEGYDYDEISKILDIPRGTVKSRLNRGRALLKTILFRMEAAATAANP